MKDDRYGVLCFLCGVIAALIIVYLAMHKPKDSSFNNVFTALSAVGSLFAGLIALHISTKSDRLIASESKRKHILFLSIIRIPLLQLSNEIFGAGIMRDLENIKRNLTPENIANDELINSINKFIQSFEFYSERFSRIYFDDAKNNIKYCDQKYLYATSKIFGSQYECKKHIDDVLYELKNTKNKNELGSKPFMNSVFINNAMNYFELLKSTINNLYEDNKDDFSKLNIFVVLEPTA